MQSPLNPILNSTILWRGPHWQGTSQMSQRRRYQRPIARTFPAEQNFGLPTLSHPSKACQTSREYPAADAFHRYAINTFGPLRRSFGRESVLRMTDQSASDIAFPLIPSGHIARISTCETPGFGRVYFLVELLPTASILWIAGINFSTRRILLSHGAQRAPISQARFLTGHGAFRRNIRNLLCTAPVGSIRQGFCFWSDPRRA
jgi:hypothetical protein